VDFTTLKEAVKRYGFDDGDPLDSWINAAYHDVESVTEWPFLEAILSNINTVSGADLITLPGDLGKIISLRDVTNTNKLEYVTRKWFEREVVDPTTRGTPDQYTLVGSDAIQLYPVPDGIYTMSIYYQKELSDLTAGSPALAIPDRLHYAVVLGAVRYALTAESEEDRAKESESLYNESIARAMSYYGLRELDEPSAVIDTAGYTNDGA
jgi:hypothetical protein